MTKEQLYDCIHNIDDDLINDVNLNPKKKKRIMRIIPVAACFLIALGIFTMINLRVKKEVKAYVKWTVIEQGEYYQISQIERNLGGKYGNVKSIQYNYVIYNGKYVLTKGISVIKPKVKVVNDKVIRVDWADLSNEYTNYCDLRKRAYDDGCSETLITKNILLEKDEIVAYLDEDYDENNTYINFMCMQAIEDYDLYYKKDIIIKKGYSDIAVSFNKYRKNFIISYKSAHGKEEKINVHLNDLDYKKDDRKIVKNKDEIKCVWSDKVLEDTKYDAIYKIHLFINREDDYSEEDDSEDDNSIFQYFIKGKNCIIEEGVSEFRPDICLVSKNIVRMKYYEWDNFVRYYQLETGEISREYEQAIFEVDGKIAVACWEKKKNVAGLELYDYFGEKGEDISDYHLKELNVISNNILMVKYIDKNNHIVSKELNLIYPLKDKEKTPHRIGKFIEMYERDAEYEDSDLYFSNDFRYQFYLIYNEKRDDIVSYGLSFDNNLEIEEISDTLIRLREYGGGEWCFDCFYDAETKEFSNWYQDVLAYTDTQVVHFEYRKNKKYIVVRDIFGNKVKKYLFKVKGEARQSWMSEHKIEGNKVVISGTTRIYGKAPEWEEETYRMEYPLN